MIPAQVIAEIVSGSRAAQGLPDRITDPAVLRRLAVLLASGRDEAPPKRGQADTLTTTTTPATTTEEGLRVHDTP